MEKGRFEPLEYLALMFGLDEFERYCLKTVWESEGETGLRGKTPEELMEGVGTYAELCHYFWDGGSLLRYFFLWTRDGDKRRLVLDERIRVFLEGDLWNYGAYQFLWDRIDPSEKTELLNGDGPVPTMERFCEKASEALPVYFHLYGNPGIGKKSRIVEFCKRRKRSLLIMDGQILLEENEELLGKALRECKIYGAYLLIQNLPEDWFAGTLRREKWFQWIAEETEIFFTTGLQPLKTGRYMERAACLELEMPMPDFKESCRLWEQRLQQNGCENLRPEEWANKFLFTPGQIKDAVQQAVQAAKLEGRKILEREDLQKGCYHLLRGNMGKKAVKIPAAYTWKELVLPENQKEKLRSACNQAAYRKKVYESWGFDGKMAYGKGISVVFAGPPGTGKTMAAQVMASELCLDLYRVELPAVVSKYIGETEKNLEEIFEQAKKSQVILFFDEADVLFSKRTEVRDSNDKYSNMESAFLLQKMEEYEGITILATNFLQNIDEAFKRRMKFIVDFPFPDAAQRLEIWKQVFPPETPIEKELDLEFLAASFELSGSNIKNTALHAAFLAASEDQPVSMRHLAMGIRNEYHKIGKMLTKTQFGQYYMLLDP